MVTVMGIAFYNHFRGKGPNNSEKTPFPEETGPTVEKLLKKMTLEEKVAQVIIAYFSGPELTADLAKELQELPLGGIILYSTTGNIENPAQVAALTERIQKSALDSGRLPLFIAVDQEGGPVARLTEGLTLFPGNMALGATDSEELAGLSAAITARELRTLGINFNFAPVVDVNNNPDNPVIGVRSFSSRPDTVARLGAAMVAPYHREGVLATAKHFPGHGDTDVDSHYGLPFISGDLSQLKKMELAPFQAMIKAGVPVVMMAHILVPGLTGGDGLPASLSAQAVRYLREEMGFDGLVITDSMGMGAITENWGLGEAAVTAFRAGVDIILFGPWTGVQPGDRREIFRALLQAVEEGTIPLERLDQSVKKILGAKIEYQIIGDPLPRRERLADLASPQNLEIARRIARESITLFRDRANLIPLPVQETVPLPLIWPVEREGSLSPLIAACPFLQPYLLSLPASTAEVEEFLTQMEFSSLVLIGSYNMQDHPAWPDLVNNLTGEKEVVLIALSSPYDLLAVPHVGTYFCTYSDSSDSMQALGQVLGGALTPRGRLPVELPGLE